MRHSCWATNTPACRNDSSTLGRAIKLIYASTFSQHAKAYVRATPYRLEEEKMAVILQEVVGAQHGTRYYPDFSGVLRSHNFYPTAPMTSADGIAAVALGMGREVVEGGRCLSFCPKYPQASGPILRGKRDTGNSQSEFWAIDLEQLGWSGSGGGTARDEI